jgi:polyhydroxybutyrate depolymerase
VRPRPRLGYPSRARPANVSSALTRATVPCCLALLALAAPRPARADDNYGAFSHPDCVGVTRAAAGRAYCLDAPPDPGPGKALPLVVLLHGYGGSGQMQADYFGLDDQVASRGFLLAKPDGTSSGFGLHWNAFPACCATWTDNPKADDVDFLMAMVHDIESAYPVDPDRIYLIGHSNGAFMAYRMACDHADTFAGVVAVAGAVEPSLCHPSHPISIAAVHGTKDRMINPEGGRTATDPAHAYASLAETVGFWVKANRCAGPPVFAGRDDLVSDAYFRSRAVRGAETEIERATGCAGGSTVEQWKMEGAGHIPLWNKARWPTAALDFLLAQRRAK